MRHATTGRDVQDGLGQSYHRKPHRMRPVRTGAMAVGIGSELGCGISAGMKRCYKCERTLPLDAFAKDKYQPSGLNGRCRECQRVYKAEHSRRPSVVAKQREHDRKYDAKVRESGAIELKRYQRARWKEIRSLFKRAGGVLGIKRCVRCEAPLGRTHRYCLSCQAEAKYAYKLQWQRKAYRARTLEQKQHDRATFRALDQRRYRTNQRYRLRKLMMTAIRHRLNGRGLVKPRGKTFSLLPYSIAALESRLRETLPDGYTWDDVLSGKLHIDHIRPVAAFKYTSFSDPEFQRCFALDNLQLLPALDNILKSDSLPCT